MGNFPEPEPTGTPGFGSISTSRDPRIMPMAVEHLFTQALGLSSPWKVVSADFDPEAKSLELVIDFIPGSRFRDRLRRPRRARSNWGIGS